MFRRLAGHNHVFCCKRYTRSAEEIRRNHCWSLEIALGHSVPATICKPNELDPCAIRFLIRRPRIQLPQRFSRGVDELTPDAPKRESKISHLEQVQLDSIFASGEAIPNALSNVQMCKFVYLKASCTHAPGSEFHANCQALLFAVPGIVDPGFWFKAEPNILRFLF